MTANNKNLRDVARGKKSALEVTKSAKLKKRGVSKLQRPSMADVAEIAGCSQSTVSVILNNTPGFKISPSTAERVLKAAEELGYRDQKRHKPVSKKTLPLAFLVDRMTTSPETVWAIDGAQQALAASGNVLLSAQTLDDKDSVDWALKYFQDQEIAGLIFASVHTRRVEIPSRLLEFKVPVVLLNCYADGDPFPTILPGEVAAGHTATNYLLNMGHTRIGKITGELWMEAATDRLEGYRRALASADIPYDEDLVREGNWQLNSGYEQTLELMRQSNPPTAIFCASDRIANGCYFALRELGLSVPEDMSVVGFDNEELSAHLVPKLTTVALPLSEMGRWAVNKINSREAETAHEPMRFKLECPLIKRASVAAPKGQNLDGVE